MPKSKSLLTIDANGIVNFLRQDWARVVTIDHITSYPVSKDEIDR